MNAKGRWITGKWTIVFCAGVVLVLVLNACFLQILLFYQNIFDLNRQYELGDAVITRSSNWTMIPNNDLGGGGIGAIWWVYENVIKQSNISKNEDSYLFANIERCKVTGHILIKRMSLDDKNKVIDEMKKRIRGEEGRPDSRVVWSYERLKTWDALIANDSGVITMLVPELGIAITTEDLEKIKNGDYLSPRRIR